MLRSISRFVLWAKGWKLEGELPVPAKYVLIASPHTSNWDGVLMVALATLYRIELSWLAKHTLFRWPFGWLLRRTGGIPVDRRGRHDMVKMAAGLFSERTALALAVPPEGTRRRVEYWKSGFYHIARSANVPIVLGYLDYGRRRAGFGPALLPSGDVCADMDIIRAFYSDKQGCHPELTTTPRLREEDAPRAEEQARR